MKKIIDSLPRYFWVMAAGWSNRFLIAAIQLLAIPIVYKLVHMQGLAIFSILTGLVGWYGLADLGIGFVLQNYISAARVNNESIEPLLAKMVPLIFFITVVEGSTVFFAGVYSQNWLLGNIHVNLPYYSLGLIAMLYTISILYTVSYKVFFGKQQGFLGYSYQTLGYIVAFILIGVLYLLHISPSITTVLLLWVAPQLIINIISFVHAFGKHIFTHMHIDWLFYKTLFSKAWQFSFYILSGNFILFIDYVIVAKLLSSQDIVVYNIVAKYFIMIITLYSSVLSASWPVLAEQFTKAKSENLQLANKIILRNIMGGLVYAVIAILFFLLCNSLIVRLLGLHQAIIISASLIILFGFYVALRIWVDTYAVALQSRNKMKILLIVTPFQAILCPVIMYMLTKTLGINGVPLSLIISFVLVSMWIFPYWHYRDLAKIKVGAK